MECVEAWKAELYRSGRRRRTVISYAYAVAGFFRANPGLEPDGITVRHIERYIGQFTGISPRTGREYKPNTRVQRECAIASFTGYLTKRKILSEDPFVEYERTKRQHPDKQEVVTVSSYDVARMLDWSLGELIRTGKTNFFLCLSFLAYLGPRRASLAQLRRKHLDLHNGIVRFPEWKGGDFFEMQIPDELLSVLRDLDRHGVLSSNPESYVVENMRPGGVRGERRQDEAIWYIVHHIAKQVGVRAHVHSLRAAFACFYVESGGDPIALKEVLGHSNLATTEAHYLRRIRRQHAMKTARGLSWGVPGSFPFHSPSGGVIPSSPASRYAEHSLPSPEGVPTPVEQSADEQVTRKGPVNFYLRAALERSARRETT